MNIYAQNHNMTDLSMLLGRRDDCPCGMPHSCEIGSVIIRRGAIEELVALTAGFEHVLLVCDENTRRAAGERVDKLLGSKIRSRVTYVSDGFLVPDEAAVEILKGGVSTQTDLIIGVGSGVINDLCKYVSFELGLPYFIVATAPSMDGYASKGAAMLFGNMKITTNAAPPAAIIADTDVLKDAPLEMLKAGYGDIIGKYSCLNDWRLSHIVNGEPLCEYVYGLTRAATDSVAPLAEAILSRDEESIATLMRALIVVGIAMAYMGNSRPASGSEHHLSHFFEVVGLLRGEPYFCHGIDVAYSTYLTALIRSALIACEKPVAHPFSPSEWEENIKRVYATENNSRAADGIIEMQNRLGWIFEDKMPIYEEKWQQICSVLLDSPTPDEVEAMLCKIELPLDSFKETYSPEKIRDAVRYAKDLKDRYTVLWLYAAVLGNEICEQI